MKKTKKALASLAIASMALTMVPFNAFATGTVPTRIAGTTAAQTAVAIADQTGWTGTAILASSLSYGMVDALTAGPLASYLKAPILLTGAGALDADTKAELTKLAVKTVYVTSGTAVISQAVLNELTGMGITVVPLGGVDRAATSVNIASKMVGVTKVAVANGLQDALSIAAVASAANEPILLTDKDVLPASVAAYLAANPGITASDVIGGTGVISDAVKAKLPAATRHAGNTAYDTNNQVIQDFNSSLTYGNVYLANGVTGIDALAGAPLAAKTKSAIVLTDGTVPAAATFVNGKLTGSSVVTALGGAAVVPASVLAGVAYKAPATLAVASVSAIDGKDIKVTFNKAAAKDSLINPANYTATFTTGAGISLDTDSANYVASDDRMSVIIPVTGGNFYNGQSFKVDVKNLIDDDYKTMTEYKDTWHLFNDTATPVLQSAAKKSGKLRLYFDESVRGTMTVKVDGVVEATSVTPAAAAGDNYANVTVSTDALKAGTHTVVVYNAADWVGASGNIAPLQTISYTLTDDTTAPSVVSVTADGGTTFKVKFSETLSNVTTANIVIKKGNATLITQAATQDADDTTVYNVTVAGTSDVDLYDSGANTTSLSVAVKGYYDGANLYGAEYDANIILSKDTTGPVIVSDTFNSSNTTTLTLKFNEDLNTSFSFDASKITVIKDSILKTVDGASVSGKSLILTINGGVTDGTYSVQLAKGTVKDKSNNDNLALSTSVAYSATNGTAYYGLGTIVVSQSGSANVITIPYQTKMTATAVDTTNYQLDGMPLPVGSSAYFTDSTKFSVQLKLPAGTIDSSVQRLLAFSKNILTDDGRVIETSGKNQLTASVTGFADNVKPVLSAAKFVIVSLSDTTTSAIRLTFNENMGATLDTDDFKVTVNGIKVTVNSINDSTSGDKYLTLNLASAINMSQSVTVEVIKAADQTDTTMGTADTTGNKLTEGTVVSVSDKTTSN